MKRPSLVARNRVSQSGELSKNARICERLASRWRAPPLPAPVPPPVCDRSGLFTSLSASLVPRHHIPAIGLIHPSIARVSAGGIREATNLGEPVGAFGSGMGFALIERAHRCVFC